MLVYNTISIAFWHAMGYQDEARPLEIMAGAPFLKLMSKFTIGLCRSIPHACKDRMQFLLLAQL